MLRPLLATLLAVCAACAQAGMGMTELPAGPDDGPVTVFYPTAADDAPIALGPFTLSLARDAAPRRGNGRLVVMSHGSGGNALTYADLARRMVDAGFVVAAPLHRGDNWRDHGDVGPASWKQRPLEVSRAIDAVARDSRFTPLLALDRVGVYGLSAGGHTALALAGGRWSPSALRRHCEAHLDDDFSTCAGPALQLDGGPLDGLKRGIVRQAIRFKLDDPQWYGHTDPRIVAAVAEVPFAVDFDLATLATPPIALGLVQAGQDRWLPARFHSGPVLQACRTCELVADLPQAGHGSLLSPRPPLEGHLAHLLADGPGFDQADVARTHERITAFFRRHLVARP